MEKIKNKLEVVSKVLHNSNNVVQNGHEEVRMLRGLIITGQGDPF